MAWIGTFVALEFQSDGVGAVGEAPVYSESFGVQEVIISPNLHSATSHPTRRLHSYLESFMEKTPW